jgi:carboxyl-terminal processing protease
MNKKLSWFLEIATGGLLFLLGIVVGVRYVQPGYLPFMNEYLPFIGATGQNSGDMSYLSKTEVTNTNQPSEYKTVDFGEFWKVWSMLERNYVDPSKIDKSKMVYGAIQGMTAALGDPYTMFLPPEQDKRTAEELAGAFYGVGIELGYVEGTIAVIAPLKGMPAEQAGVQAGDLILHVKDAAKNLDEDTNGWTLDQAVGKIRGERGTSVTLTLFRKDATQPIILDIKRDEIVIPSVELKYVEHNGKRVAHIQLSRFGERTDDEWDAIVKDILSQQKVDGILLDMRNNPGGYFQGAINIASEFISSGTVVSQKGRITSEDFKAKGRARLEKYEVEVLVNRGSASASEIVAGALRDVRKAKLIGENTFGKGTVQDRIELEEGGGVHITVARWLLPGGDWIHETGIPVNVEVKNDPETEQDEVVLKAIEEI